MAKIRKTDVYNIKNSPIGDDYVIGTDSQDNNKTKNFKLGAIVDLALLQAGISTESSTLVSVGNIAVNEGQVTVTGAIWRIQNEEYTIEEQVLEVIPAEEGLYRTDIIYGSNDGQLHILEGQPSTETAAQPATPLGSILVGVINLFGPDAEPVVPPASDAKLKSSEAWQKLSGTGVLDSLPWAQYNGYRWSSANNLILRSLSISDLNAAYRYDGRSFYICNATTADKTITISHLQGSGNCQFFTADGEDVVLTAGQIAVFRYYASSPTTGRLELIAKPESENETTIQSAADADAQTITPIVTVTPELDKKLMRTATGEVYREAEKNITTTYATPVADVTYTVPAKEANDTYAMLSDFEQDLPDDFMMFLPWNSNDPSIEPGTIEYITDSTRTFNLNDYLPVPVTAGSNGSHITILGNDVYILYKKFEPTLGSTSPFALSALRNCTIVRNKFKVGFTDHVDLLDFNTNIGIHTMRLHGEGYHKGYLYFVSRTYDYTVPTQIFRINSHNLADYTMKETFPGGAVNNIQIVDDYIYLVEGNDSITGPSYIGRIPCDLSKPFERLITIGTEAGKRFYRGFPFTIDKGEIFIPTWRYLNDDIYRTTIGIQVFDIRTGVKLREHVDIQIISQPTPENQPPYPHWMAVIGEKLLLHTGVAGGGPRKVIRIEKTSLQLEDVADIYFICGDNVTITPSGWLYFNPENYAEYEQQYGVKVFYDDFSTIQSYHDAPFWSSCSSIFYGLEQTDVHLYNTSQLKNTGADGTSPFATQAWVTANGGGGNVSKIIKQNVTDSPTLTGNVVETIMDYKLVAANEIGYGVLDFSSLITKVGTAGNVTIKLYLNTTSGLTGANSIATYNTTASTLYDPTSKRFIIKPNNVIQAMPIAGRVDSTSTSGVMTNAFNPAQAYYLILTAKLSNAADSVVISNFELIFKKAV